MSREVANTRSDAERTATTSRSDAVGRLATDESDPSVGLLAFWRFDGDLTDASGNSKDLSAAGSPDYTTGKLGQCLRSPTSADYAERTELIVSSGSFSMAGWFYETDEVTRHFLGQFDDGGGATNGINLHRSLNGGPVRFRVGSGLGGIVTGARVSMNTWNHFAGTFNGTTAVIYINGIYLASGELTPAFPSSSPRTRILAGGSGGTGNNCLADMCGIWSVALTQNQVLSLYNNGNGFDPTA